MGSKLHWTQNNTNMISTTKYIIYTFILVIGNGISNKKNIDYGKFSIKSKKRTIIESEQSKYNYSTKDINKNFLKLRDLWI